MASLSVIHHPDCARHDPDPRHPERPARIEAVLAGIRQLDRVQMSRAKPATREQLLHAHRPGHVDRLLGLEQEPGAGDPVTALDSETLVGHGSIRAARLAAGATCQAVDQVAARAGRPAFAVVRPPGHHATAGRSMGFCVFNSVAVAAEHALESAAIRKIVICDFDVHHGNGTESIFAGRRDVVYASSHQHPLYPGSGDPHHPIAPNIHNAGLSPGAGSDAFRDAWKARLFGPIDRFAPDLVLVSAGFDAHWRDPLAQLQLKDEDFYWIGHQLKLLADTHAGGRLVATLEGGYDLQALTSAALAFAEGITFAH